MRRREKKMVYRKKVIKLLIKKRMTTKDLIEESKIPRRTLYRILGELQPDLITKENGFWVWCQNLSSIKTEADLEHSKLLIPALKALMIQGTGEDVGYALEHLKSYPRTFSRLQKLRKLGIEWKRIMEGKFGRYMRISRGQEHIPEKDVGDSWLKKFFGNSIKESTRFDSRRDLNDEEKKELQKLYNSIQEQNLVLKLIKIEYDMTEVYKEVAGDIHFLIRRITHGAPLEGRCAMCPPITKK